MKNIAIPKSITDTTTGAILITGVSRSGTSILGNLIGSLSNIEYFYEPPLLHTLSGLMALSDLQSDYAALLMLSYISNDMLITSAHGRNLNLRQDDFSWTFNTTAWKELTERWGAVGGYQDALEYIKARQIRSGFKMVNCSAQFIRLFLDHIEKGKIIYIIRSGLDVVASMINKGWLVQESFDKAGNYAMQMENQNIFHAWAPIEWKDFWTDLNQYEKACLIWSEKAKSFRKIQPEYKARISVIRFEDLLQAPFEEIKNASIFLETVFGPLTEQNILKVSKKRPNKSDTNFKSFVDAKIWKAFTREGFKWGYLFE